MARIVVFTPRQVRRYEDAFAQLVGESLSTVAVETAKSLGGVITAAAEPAPIPPQTAPPPVPVVPPAGVAVEDLAVISGLWAGQVSAILAPQVAESFTDAAEATSALLGGAFPDWPLPEVSDSFAESYLSQALNRLQGIGDAFWNAARESLVEGFALGESIAKLRDRVMAAANVSQARANVIARTEIIGASNAGSITQVRVTGLVGTKEWLATNDERTRCTHRAADGQTVDLDGKFTLGGELTCGDFGVAHLDRPGDPDAPAGEIIQCRCSMAFDLDVPDDAVADEANVPLVAAAQVHTGAMIALRMTEADARAMELEGYEDADELHVTLMYLGEAADFDAAAQTNIHQYVASAAAMHGPITTDTFSVNIFNPRTDEFDTAIVLGVRGGDSGLEQLRDDAVLPVMKNYDVHENHTPWVPHITLAYLPADNTDLDFVLTEAMDRLGSVTFDRIRVAFAEDNADYTLGYDDREVLVSSGDPDWNPAEHPKGPDGKFIDKAGGGGGSKIVKTLTNAVIYGKHNDGDVIATSQDGTTVVKYDGKANKIDINGKKVGKAEAYKQLKTKENWVLGGAPGGNVAPPTTPPPVAKPKPPTPPTMTSIWNLVTHGDYDNYVVAEAHAKDGTPVSRYVVHDSGMDATIVQETTTDGGKTWNTYKTITSPGEWDQKLVDLKHSQLLTQPIDPVQTQDHSIQPKVPTVMDKPSAPSIPTVTPGVTPATLTVPIATQKAVKQKFKYADVKWWTNVAVIFPVAHKAAAENNLTLSQVLEIMDGTTTTKTSDKPFTDKVSKYLKTKKGEEHAIQLLTSSGVAAAMGGPKPGLTKPSYTPSHGYGAPSTPPAPTLSFTPSTADLKSDADFKILGVSGATDLKSSMDKAHGDWKPSEKAALRKYTSNYYHSMNGCLRKPSTCTEQIIKDNENAKSGMRPTTRDMRVTRGSGLAALGIHTSGYGAGSSPDVIAQVQALVGKTLVEPGFLSTSVTPSPAFGGMVHFEIDVPEGTNAAWVKPISNYPNENEMLLDAGLHYRIKEVLPPGPGHSNYLVRMEVVGP